MISIVQLLLEVSIEQLKDQFVTSGKMSQDIFNRIETACDHKSAYMTWMVSKVADGMIPEDQIDNFHEYFDLFSRLKAQFPQKDLGQIKSVEAVNTFIAKAKELQEKVKNDPSKNKGLSRQDKFQQFFLGNVKTSDGVTWRAYKIPKTTDPKRKAELYPVSTELGRGSHWCTAAEGDPHDFNRYIKMDDLYIFIDPSSQRKYQFNYEDGDFYNETDYEDKNGKITYELLKYLQSREGRDIPRQFKAHDPKYQKTIDSILSSRTNVQGIDTYIYDAPKMLIHRFLQEVGDSSGCTYFVSLSDNLDKWLSCSEDEQGHCFIFLNTAKTYSPHNFSTLIITKGEENKFLSVSPDLTGYGSKLGIDPDAIMAFKSAVESFVVRQLIKKLPVVFLRQLPLQQLVDKLAIFRCSVNGVKVYSIREMNAEIRGLLRLPLGNSKSILFLFDGNLLSFTPTSRYGTYPWCYSQKSATVDTIFQIKDLLLSPQVITKLTPCIEYLVNAKILKTYPVNFGPTAVAGGKSLLSALKTTPVENLPGQLQCVRARYISDVYDILRGIFNIRKPFILPASLFHGMTHTETVFILQENNNKYYCCTNVYGKLIYQKLRYVDEQIKVVTCKPVDSVIQESLRLSKLVYGLVQNPQIYLSSPILTSRFMDDLRKYKQNRSIDYQNSTYDLFVISKDFLDVSTPVYLWITGMTNPDKKGGDHWTFSNILNVNNVRQSNTISYKFGYLESRTGMDINGQLLNNNKQLFDLCKRIQKEIYPRLIIPEKLTKLFEKPTALKESYAPISSLLVDNDLQSRVGIIWNEKDRTGKGISTSYGNIVSHLHSSALNSLQENAELYHVKWTTAYVYRNNGSVDYILKGEPESGNTKDLVWWTKNGFGQESRTQILKGPATEIGNTIN